MGWELVVLLTKLGDFQGGDKYKQIIAHLCSRIS